MENKSAIERAREYGIDISLLEESLQRTMSERFDTLVAMADLYEEGVKFRAHIYGGQIVSDTISGYPEEATGE